MSAIAITFTNTSLTVRFLRLIFLFSVVSGAAVFFSHPQYIKVDTNLNDLNPEKIEDAGLRQALASISEDVSHRFVMVITGNDDKAVSQARQALQNEFNSIPSLSIISKDTIRKNYLSALSPYRFNLLSDPHRLAFLTSKKVIKIV